VSLKQYWLNAVDFLVAKSFDERLIRLLEMRADERSLHTMSIFGPSDAGLVELALREGCVLFTNDGRLHDFAGRNGVHCELFDKLVQRSL
jgi:rRNA-processing protein FCF1